MAKIIAFAGSNSSSSINYQFLELITSKIEKHEVELLDLRTLNIPMYGMDVENKQGIPEVIDTLHQEIQKADKILIASPEHNGNLTAYLKSTLDWLSRVKRDFLKGKQSYIVATSPGRGGATGSLQNLQNFITRLDGEVVAQLSLPSWNHVFEENELIEPYASELQVFLDEMEE